MKILNYAKRFFILILIALAGCEAPTLVDDPPPFLDFLESPNAGDSLDVDFTYFLWKGSNKNYVFNYTLYFKDELNVITEYLDNSSYSNLNEIFFDNLDEGTFILRVRGKSFGITDSLDLEFTVDAIRGASITFFKNENTVSVGDNFSLHLWIEDIESLKAFRTVIRFNQSLINLVSIEKGDLIEEINFNQMILPVEYTEEGNEEIDNTNETGVINLSSGFLTESVSNPQKAISGSGSILKLNFNAVRRGEGEVEYTLIEFYDEDGNKYQPAVPKNALVIVN